MSNMAVMRVYGIILQTSFFSGIKRPTALNLVYVAFGYLAHLNMFKYDSIFLFTQFPSRSGLVAFPFS